MTPADFASPSLAKHKDARVTVTVKTLSRTRRNPASPLDDHCPDRPLFQCGIGNLTSDLRRRGAQATPWIANLAALSNPCFDGFHIRVRQAEMVADLVD